VLRWLIQRDVVVIPKSVRAERMRENIDVFDFELTDDQMRSIAALDTGTTLFFDHRHPEMVSRLGAVRVDWFRTSLTGISLRAHRRLSVAAKSPQAAPVWVIAREHGSAPRTRPPDGLRLRDGATLAVRSTCARQECPHTAVSA
jgi:Aldo/keto reductase family